MKKLYGDTDKYGSENEHPLVEAFHGAVRDLVRREFAKSNLAWSEFVFGTAHQVLSADRFAEIDRRALDYGHRYQCSALVSAQERPDAYIDAEGIGEDLADFSFEHPQAVAGDADGDGWAQCGIGDNVAKYDFDLEGAACYVRSSAMVLDYLKSGVPPDTIAVIDDSGGTLTAPILEQFKGVLCAGGSVRSHLGILTREYGIPCFMNAKLSGIRQGDRVRMQTTGTAKTAEDYQRSIEVTSKVWRLIATAE